MINKSCHIFDLSKSQTEVFRKKVRFFLLGLAFFLCFVLTSTTAAAENLLINGSFEETDEDGLPTGWMTDAYLREEGYSVFSCTEDVAEHGNKSAYIRNIGKNDARFAQQVPLEPESLYRFSGYIKTEGVEEGRGANLSIEGLYVFSESVYDTSDGWQYIEWYGETGEHQTSATLFARLGGYSGESLGKAWFDELELIQVQSVPGDDVADLWYQPQTISYYDEDEDESAYERTSSAAWPRLILLGLLYTISAILLIQWMNRKEDSVTLESRRNGLFAFICGLGLSLLLRLILSYYITGYMVDVNCFISWGATMARVGPAGFYPETNFCDYPPAYTYVLGLNSLLCNLIPGIDAGMQRVIFRFIPSLCDLFCCLVLNRFIQKNIPSISAFKRHTGLLILAFHPVLIMNSAAWGQMDSVLALLILLVALWAIENKWELSLPCYMLAVLVKPQALMLGFLGLAAIVFTWLRNQSSRRSILRGIVYAFVVLLIVVIPFSLHQDPFWIVKQYADTLASYPYATVNTANFYYLLNANWISISNEAPAFAALLLMLLCLAYGALLYLKGKAKWRYLAAEESLVVLSALFFLFCALRGASWGLIGTGAMVFAFVIVLSLYIRKGDISFLPYLGGLLFLILYVFGIKMHERYIFPAFLLFALAYGLQRDRRILTVLLGITCTTFLNEGIVLDNSIRLGSSMGHLNQDTVVLGMILAAANCLITLYAVNTGVSLALIEARETNKPIKRILKDPARDHSLHWRKADTLILSLMLASYSLLAFSTLGSMKAPQTAWTSSEYTENIILDLGEEQDSFTMLYFSRVSRYDFSVSVSQDGKSWDDETWAEMDQGQCWKWKYVTNSTQNEGGTRKYGSDRHWFSGRFVKITAHQINLNLCEVIFRDADGNQLPVTLYERNGGDPDSPIYSDPSLIIDEQDTLEGLPVYFQVRSLSAAGEENPLVAQPSWWNSTYFDEIYHARTAYEFLVGTTPYETSHPPLGKVLMSWGVSLFGMTPFGWRFAGAVAGVAMLAVLYLIGKQMTKSTRLAAFAGGLMVFDCMHLTQTQIATIDSFPVLFILIAFFFMLRHLQTDWTSIHRARILSDLGLSGLSMGLAIASKWIGIYAGAGLAILYFWHGLRVIRSHRGEGAFRQFFRNCLWCVLFFIFVPCVIYLLSYIPYFTYMHFTNPKDYLDAVIASQNNMFSYHAQPGLGMDHPFYSPWYEWPVIGKPMYYAMKQYLFNDELSYSIFCIGNPVIWWAGIPALIVCAWCWIRNREERLVYAAHVSLMKSSLDTNLVFLLVGFLAQYLPWTLVPRGTYIYHYFASVPFLILALTIIADQVLLKYSRAGKRIILCFLILAAAGFMLFLPYSSGAYVPVSWLDAGKSLLRVYY